MRILRLLKIEYKMAIQPLTWDEVFDQKASSQILLF